MNRTELLESAVADQLKSDDQLGTANVGDTIDVHYLIVEGEKERVQVFQGVLIGVRGRGVNRMMTVRRIVANEGVERVLPTPQPAYCEGRGCSPGRCTSCESSTSFATVSANPVDFAIVVVVLKRVSGSSK